MSRAEERALKAYPNIKIGEQRIDQSSAREVYVEGYKQAEKDLELTLEDISKIREILCGMVGYPLMTDKEVCAEVLKRFKDFKERKK